MSWSLEDLHLQWWHWVNLNIYRTCLVYKHKTAENMYRKLGNYVNSLDWDWMFIRPGEYHDECIHQVWDQFPERFVWKSIETTQNRDGQMDRKGQTYLYVIHQQCESTKRKKNKANLRDLIAATGLVISNWIKIVNFSARVTVKFVGLPCKTIGHLFYATSSFVRHFVAIGEFKLELQSGNGQSGSNSTIFRAVRPWNLMDDLAKQ